MRFIYFFTLALSSLLACSGDKNDVNVAPELSFLSYETIPQPRGGLCTDTVDVQAPLIVSGFGFNLNNTRNLASAINSTNVDTLAIYVLFASSLDGVVKAFDTSDGTEIWSLDTTISFSDINGVDGKGGTIDSVGVVISGDGVLINSEYNTFQAFDGRRYQAGPGNALFVLSLPQEP